MTDREVIKQNLIRTLADLENRKKGKSIEDRLASAGLSLQEVIEYAFQKADEEVNSFLDDPVGSFEAVDNYRFKLPKDIVEKLGGESGRTEEE